MTEIPKPVESKPPLKDKRIEYLVSWKKLFSDLNPDIIVFIRGDDIFYEELNKVYEMFKEVIYKPHKHDECCILVLFPPDILGQKPIHFLVGEKNDAMFSSQDVFDDIEVCREHEIDFREIEPERNTWEYHYCLAYNLLQEQIKEIPKPNSR